ncbi:Oidioi.mRNA.OKI2018_I69.chr1.g2253.t1.cds [Oikopleura dioica]|uniref:Oidioi.mRNA.OKI2018_I69.chr1.g2253.t1.cds n=1 Tax=Oikopleura dioica TaxID=34765 RepID=A0ABN7SSA0_OIKDI|nr:Oidioi.mRNA.OKI2018_I69.chr1.g2253.t1.cds [Oikopleura dioica]
MSRRNKKVLETGMSGLTSLTEDSGPALKKKKDLPLEEELNGETSITPIVLSSKASQVEPFSEENRAPTSEPASEEGTKTEVPLDESSETDYRRKYQGALKVLNSFLVHQPLKPHAGVSAAQNVAKLYELIQKMQCCVNGENLSIDLVARTQVRLAEAISNAISKEAGLVYRYISQSTDFYKHKKTPLEILEFRFTPEDQIVKEIREGLALLERIANAGGENHSIIPLREIFASHAAEAHRLVWSEILASLAVSSEVDPVSLVRSVKRLKFLLTQIFGNEFTMIAHLQGWLSAADSPREIRDTPVDDQVKTLRDFLFPRKCEFMPSSEKYEAWGLSFIDQRSFVLMKTGGNPVTVEEIQPVEKENLPMISEEEDSSAKEIQELRRAMLRRAEKVTGTTWTEKSLDFDEDSMEDYI